MRLLFLLFIFAILLNSCDNKTITPVEEFDYRNYLPLDSGDTWDYIFYGIDTNNKPSQSEFAYSTTYYLDTLIHMGRKAYRMDSEDIVQGNISNNVFYYSLDSNKIAISNMYFSITDSARFRYTKWLDIYNLYVGDWKDEAFIFRDTTIGNSVYNGYVAFSGSKRNQSEAEFDGKKVKFITGFLYANYNIDRYLGKDTIRIRHNEVYEYRFGKDIGLIFSRYLDNKDSTKLGGYEKVLKDYEN
ncbi:MAG: hypothetical protein WC121_06385 [Candidatus Kapaibacterium sp.]